MKTLTLGLICVFVIVGSSFKSGNLAGEKEIYPELAQTLKTFKRNGRNISYDRQDVLMGIQQMVITNQIANKKLNIEIADADNSFQSQVAQVLLRTALASIGIDKINVYSAGSTSGTLSPVVEKQLTKMGFKVTKDANGLQVKYADGAEVLLLYAKTLNNAALPTQDVIHVALCVQGEGGSCAFSGDKHTTQLFYNFANADKAAEIDEETSRIGADMFWVANKIKEIIKN